MEAEQEGSTFQEMESASEGCQGWYVVTKRVQGGAKMDWWISFQMGAWQIGEYVEVPARHYDGLEKWMRREQLLVPVRVS